MEKIKIIISWIKKNKKEFLILLTILLVAAFCRLYKIDQYMTFLGDEGRDVIIVRRLLVEGHPPLIGPGTSIGNMYLGPLYYYLMAPALLLANFSPVGPAIEIAILGIITVLFVWWVGREWFDKNTGLIAAALYAISPTVITYSRSSWNPNIMPFFALLSIYAVWRIWKYNEFKWMVVLGAAFAFVLQSHYLGLLLIPTLAIFYLLSYIRPKTPMENSKIIKLSLMGYGLFLILMSPLLFFDMRHNWINSQAIYKFFTVRQETVSIRPWAAIPKIPEILNQVNSSMIGAKNVLVGQVLSVVMAIWFGWSAWLRYKKKSIQPFGNLLILFSWIFFGLIGFGLYKQQIYDHYFGFIFAVPFLVLGLTLSRLLKMGSLGKLVAIASLTALIWINLSANPLRYSPNLQLKRGIDVAQKIESESEEKPFNLAVLAERNYEDGYQYFLEKDSFPVIDIDAQRPETITEQLFVVCELPVVKCDPTHSPKAEAANFGWSKIDMQWEVMGVTIYKLVHTEK